MIDVEVVADSVLRRMESSSGEIIACWVQVEEGRNEYAMNLRRVLERNPVAVIIVEGIRFDNANSLLEDLLELVKINRSYIEKIWKSSEGNIDKIALVLISRSSLCIPQLSSPMLFPEWFPVRSSRSVWTTIEDITWRADCSLNHQVLYRGEISELLFLLEEAILEKLKASLHRNRRNSNALFEIIRRQKDPPETFDMVLHKAQETLEAVHNPQSFRPSVRKGKSMVARLWSLTSQNGLEKLAGPAKALARALDLKTDSEFQYYESLVASFGRPSTPDPDNARRFARNLLLTILMSCQLATAAAHADEYRRYPYNLLRAVSYDLRLSLQDIIKCLKSFETWEA